MKNLAKIFQNPAKSTQYFQKWLEMINCTSKNYKSSKPVKKIKIITRSKKTSIKRNISVATYCGKNPFV